MRVAWQRGKVTVRDVYDSLGRNRNLAYTTVMTTMHRLTNKGFLQRSELGAGRTHAFWPAISEDEYVQSALQAVLDWLVARFDMPALTYLMHPDEKDNLESLRALLEAVEKRREELSSGD